LNSERIHEVFLALKDALAQCGATLYDSKGTLMTWADFRNCLPPNPTWEDEE